MNDDLESVVRKTAAFIGIQHERNIEKAVEMSSFEFMKGNQKKFADMHIARYRNEACGVPHDAVPNKVVTGSASKGRELMDDKTKEIIQGRWLEVVAKQAGFQDYNELRSAFQKNNN
ncbi:Hypothetical predicted protein [Paramuricea clavata]|uniref:Sulfotransferase domain-containing protein n=1 Tax=Paramuricea clavata TaxID=317549 RepID=A0A7D9DT13_PARCT|nr:Hypothetical predicted protein [Paramuricea clavata]